MISNGATGNVSKPEEEKIPPPANGEHEEEDDVEEVEGGAPATASEYLFFNRPLGSGIHSFR